MTNKQHTLKMIPQQLVIIIITIIIIIKTLKKILWTIISPVTKILLRQISTSYQKPSVMRIDLFHIVFAHACIGHVTRYFSIIGETLYRWGKRISSH